MCDSGYEIDNIDFFWGGGGFCNVQVHVAAFMTFSNENTSFNFYARVHIALSLGIVVMYRYGIAVGF